MTPPPSAEKTSARDCQAGKSCADDGAGDERRSSSTTEEHEAHPIVGCLGLHMRDVRGRHSQERNRVVAGKIYAGKNKGECRINLRVTGISFQLLAIIATTQVGLGSSVNDVIGFRKSRET